MKKRITQKEIAALANVCQGAVSAVLNPHYRGNTNVGLEARERILKIAAEHNYVPNFQARALRGAASGLVGVLTNMQISQFFYDLLLPLEGELHKVHKRMLIGQIGNAPQESEEVLRSFVNYNLEGVIVLHHDIVDGARLFQQYTPLLPQLVFLDAPPEGVHGRRVCLDYANGMREMVEHLLKKGRRKIGLFMNDVTYHSMQARFQGYQSALQAAGIPVREELLMIEAAENAEVLAQLAARAVDRLVVEGNANAIVAGNDRWALALAKELIRRGISIPGDVAIAGYGNTRDICLSATPELSSVHHAVEEAASQLAASFMDNSADRDASILVRTHPVYRASTEIN